MLKSSNKQIRNLFLALSLALCPLTAAMSYELRVSDMGIYRADVVQKVFDAVKNSPSYSRVVIRLHINALGKITSCKVIKSSGDASLDAAMMKALSEVSLKPMRFASSIADTAEIQICFGNRVPSPKNLYIAENEAFTYRSPGAFMQIAGPISAGNNDQRSNSSSITAHQAFTPSSPPLQTSASSVVPQSSKDDHAFVDEITRLLSDNPAEITFESLQFNLNQIPESATQLAKADAATVQKRYLAASQAYIIALLEPYKNGDVESLRTVLNKLSKLMPNLQPKERFSIGMSLVNASEKIRSRMPFSDKDLKSKNAACIDSILSTAQQFVDESSSKQLGRLSNYYQSRGKIFQDLGNVDKAKVAYQRSLSLMLENEFAQQSDVEQAFDATVNFLTAQNDQNALREVESQREVWESKHPDPTNLFAIYSCCKRIESQLRNPDTTSIDTSIQRLLKLIATSSLQKTDSADALLSRSGASLLSINARLNLDPANRSLQELVHASELLARRGAASSDTEHLLKESFKLAIRLRNQQIQSRAFQALADYLIVNGHAQEALNLCEIIDQPDTEFSPIVQARMNPLQNLRMKALRALGRSDEANRLQTQVDQQVESLTQNNIQRNLAVAEQRLTTTAPYSTEKLQARTLLVTSLLSSKQPDIQKAKTCFLEGLQEVLSEKFKSPTVFNYSDLTNQLSAILNKSTPDLAFMTEALQDLLQLQLRLPTGNPSSLAAFSPSRSIIRIIDDSKLASNPAMRLALIRALVKLSDQKAFDQNDGIRLALLRKEAEIEQKSNDLESAAKTNLQIVNLIERQKNYLKTDLVTQLLALAKSEVEINKVELARKHEKRAADLNFESTDSASTATALTELSKAYSEKGDLRDAEKTLLEAVKLPSLLTSSPRAKGKPSIYTRAFVNACKEHKQLALAKEFFQGAIEFEKTKNAHSASLNDFRLEYAELLLDDAFTNSTPQESLLNQSAQLFDEAAADLQTSEGNDSTTLGQAVQRRAFLLELNGKKELAEGLIEKYKAAASNSGGGNLTMDVNVGKDPEQPNQKQ